MLNRKILFRSNKKPLLWGLITLALAFALVLSSQGAWGKTLDSPVTLASPLHPTFPLLDEAGVNVLESGGPVSTMQTCGSCHATDFIAEHSFHANVGLNDFTNPGEVPNGRTWDTSPGWFGKWNPITYRYLSPAGDERLDLSTPAWIQTLGARVAPGDPETHIVDPETGELISWDWQESGVVEMNCFLCHTEAPNNEARLAALREGDFRWANTATLLGTGLVEQVGDAYQWNPAAFQENGELAPEFVTLQDPTNDNCGQCHGLVHDNLQEPLAVAGCLPERWETETTGQIISGQKLSNSGMNLANKENLNRSWDIHAERLLNCTDCHYALNNPVYFQSHEDTRPEHLTFDPRRLELGEYLAQPLHQFARGQSAQSTVDPALKDTMRRCESCHDTEATHDWLPYKDRHMNAIRCESCHIPKMYSTAYQQFDWTVIRPDGNPQTACRGIVGELGDFKSLITGFEPVLLPSQEADGATKIAPFNLITSWYWVYGEPERPVRLIDLKAAWLEGEDYHPEVLALFDQNGDGTLDKTEALIDSPAKEALIAGRLQALGLENPRIVGEIQPYSINHNVTHGEWATQDCQACHSETSRINRPFQLAKYVPNNVMPEFVKDSNTVTNGELYIDERGELYYQPQSAANGLYILGHDEVGWIDLGGSLLFLGTLLGVVVHGGLRFYASLRQPPFTSGFGIGCKRLSSCCSCSPG